MKCSVCGRRLGGEMICPYCGSVFSSKRWFIGALLAGPVLVFALLRLFGK